ncbi:MAG: hypothetical protein QGI24_08615, partial [Kiritimatiellia bacterium]|nr:hypothetical protein [Kiritimatiellia bacterium]
RQANPRQVVYKKMIPLKTKAKRVAKEKTMSGHALPLDLDRILVYGFVDRYVFSLLRVPFYDLPVAKRLLTIACLLHSVAYGSHDVGSRPIPHPPFRFLTRCKHETSHFIPFGSTDKMTHCIRECLSNVTFSGCPVILLSPRDGRYNHTGGQQTNGHTFAESHIYSPKM